MLPAVNLIDPLARRRRDVCFRRLSGRRLSASMSRRLARQPSWTGLAGISARRGRRAPSRSPVEASRGGATLVSMAGKKALLASLSFSFVISVFLHRRAEGTFETAFLHDSLRCGLQLLRAWRWLHLLFITPWFILYNRAGYTSSSMVSLLVAS